MRRPQRPLLVGESNPYGPDPRYALYCEPPQSAGGRLCRVIMGLRPETYLTMFDRMNLVVGSWVERVAHERAACVIATEPPVLVLLGARVRQAFGLGAADVFTFGAMPWGGQVAVLPHPSARCRLWDAADAIKRTRNVLLAILPGAPFGEADHVDCG